MGGHSRKEPRFRRFPWSPSSAIGNLSGL